MVGSNQLILSVKTETLLDQAWELLANDGENVDEVMTIYTKLGQCQSDIRKCTSEKEYMKIWADVTECEKLILKYA